MQWALRDESMCRSLCVTKESPCNYFFSLPLSLVHRSFLLIHLKTKECMHCNCWHKALQLTLWWPSPVQFLQTKYTTWYHTWDSTLAKILYKIMVTLEHRSNHTSILRVGHCESFEFILVSVLVFVLSIQLLLLLL